MDVENSLITGGKGIRRVSIRDRMIATTIGRFVAEELPTAISRRQAKIAGLPRHSCRRRFFLKTRQRPIR
jgi:hypothetical protein